MFKFNKKLIPVLALLIMVGLVLISCGKGQQETKTESKSSKQAEVKTEKKEVKFPQETVTTIVPFAAGGGTDQSARMIAGLAEKITGVPWVCKNVTGSAGAVAMEELKKAKPDGYTIMLITSNISILEPMGLSKLTYKDFEPIAAVHSDPLALIVRKDSGWNSLEDFIKAAKERKLKVQTGAAGGLWQVGTLAMAKTLGLDLNIVPSGGGGAPATPALLGKQVDAICVAPPDALPGLKSGDFKILVMLGPKRSKLDPNAPTMAELGYDKIKVQAVRTYFAPKGTPPEIIKKLHDIIKEAATSQKYKEFAESTGAEALYMDTSKVKEYLAWEYEAYKELLDIAGLLKKK